MSLLLPDVIKQHKAQTQSLSQTNLPQTSVLILLEHVYHLTVSLYSTSIYDLPCRLPVKLVPVTFR